MAADLSAAYYAERGLQALAEGDIPRAVGAFASISRESWTELSDRFPGFPAQFDTSAAPAIAMGGTAPSIEQGATALDDEPDWTALGTRR